MIVETKLSLMMTLLIDFQSSAVSPKRKHIDSRTALTAAGGLDMDRNSTKCCRLMLLTAEVMLGCVFRLP